MTATCPLCDRKSLLFYPVRYAVACPRGAAKAPGLSGHFKIDSRAPQSIATAKYTLRALRPGYLYTYDERRRRLRAYTVLEDGIMWSFPPGSTPPPPDAEGLMTQGCANAGDLSFETLGRCVDIEYTPGCDNPAGMNFWIGWSNVRWTKDLVFNKIHDTSWRKQHMQCIEVQKVLAGAADDTASFDAAYQQIAHFSMNEQAMKDAFGFSNRDPKSEITQGKRKLPPRIIDAMRATPNQRGFILAVNDPVGIANDLSELTVPSLNNGFDEEMYWKATSAQLLERAKEGLRARASEMAELKYGSSAAAAKANTDLYSKSPPPVGAMGVPDTVGGFNMIISLFKPGSTKKAMDDWSRKVTDMPATKKEAADDAWIDASTKFDEHGKRVPALDLEALKRFPDEYQKALDAFHPTWQKLTQAHADWLSSKLLSDWLTGITDRQDIRSGFAYSESCSQAIGSSAGTEACMKVMNDWLSQADLSNTRNLIARGLLFSQDDLMNAAGPKLHGSDIQYESFLNIYKGSFLKLEKQHGQVPLRDRLILTIGNVIVATLTKAGESAGAKLAMIRLHLQAGVAIKLSNLSTGQFTEWMLKQADDLGIELKGSNNQQREDASLLAHKTINAANASDSKVVALQMDVETLQRTGRLEEGIIQEVKIPGATSLKRWLGASAPADFNLGVATAIIQMATFAFATKDWMGSDQFSNDENKKKFWCCVTAIAGNVVETISGTVKVAAKEPHPLSAYLLEHWAGAGRYAKIGVGLGRFAGSFAGAVLAWGDMFKNAPEAWRNHEKGLARLYVVSGALGFYVAVFALTGSIPLFWPVFIASIVVSVGIAMLKSSELSDWVKRCKFSTGEHYRTFDGELAAFNSAI
ncbi:T6SS effector BTH_I2691 family protein [Burkholderia pyrrocinia]|uniref:T6SS effector BTH_I2691 family protein n=1 Tax=Burkholderia pyrrocinia TaxID=60550 RepID=UPI00158E84EE|nr:T6SS effector BTH_I2691 family protein [Burkholderia pyrrocinia]